MIPFGSPHSPPAQANAFHEACTRIYARFGPYPKPVQEFIIQLKDAHSKTSQLQRCGRGMRIVSPRAQASITATRKAIEGINRHREKL